MGDRQEENFKLWAADLTSNWGVCRSVPSLMAHGHFEEGQSPAGFPNLEEEKRGKRERRSAARLLAPWTQRAQGFADHRAGAGRGVGGGGCGVEGMFVCALCLVMS